MRSQLSEFLKILKDYELAAFYKYRFDSFMPNSRQKILSELNKRGININYIHAVKIPVDLMDKKEELCPRCHSQHYYYSEETDLISFDITNIELQNEFKTCLVCLYSKEKANYERAKKKQWTIFHRLKFINSNKKW